MSKISVVSVTVSTRFPGNGRPRSGWATFSDGKEYEFHEWEESPPYIKAHIRFYTSYPLFPDAEPGHRHYQKTSFQSPKRALALREFLDSM